MIYIYICRSDIYIYVYVHIYIYIYVYIYIYIYSYTYYIYRYILELTLSCHCQRLAEAAGFHQATHPWVKKTHGHQNFFPEKEPRSGKLVDIYPRENPWKKLAISQLSSPKNPSLNIFCWWCLLLVAVRYGQLWFLLKANSDSGPRRFQQADLTSHSDHHTMFEDYKNETSKQIIIDSIFPFLYSFLYPICWWFWTHLTLW